MVIIQKKKKSLFTFWERARFEGGERETDLLVHAYCITSPSSLIFSLFFSVFFLIFFLVFLLYFSFYFVKMLCFLIPFSGHGKGPFIVPAMTNALPFYPLTAFVCLGVLADHQVCATSTFARQRQICFVPQYTVTLLPAMV